MKLLDALLARLWRNKEKPAVPGTVGHLVSEAHAVFLRGDFPGARELLLKALEHKDEIQNEGLLVWIFNILALTWYRLEQYRECVEFFSQHIAKYPAEALGYSFRALVFRRRDGRNGGLLEGT